MNNLKENTRFFNFLAKYYDLFGKNLSRKFYIAVKEEISIKENSRILDAGCGTGNLLKLLAESGKDLKLYGIDISQEMLKIAGKKLGLEVKLKQQQAEKLNLKNHFDCIFSNDAFHHYSNQEKVMENFYIALKKEGLLIIMDFNFGFIFNKIFHLIEPGNTRIYSKKEFRKLFEAYNFKNIYQEKIGLFSVMTVGRK